MASSMLWDWKADRIARLDEVQEVSAMLYLNGPVKIGDKDWFSYIIGVTPEYPRAGPWLVTAGKAIPGPGEAVIPAVISELTGITIGQEIMLVDQSLRVVGLTEETFSMASSIVFVSRQDLGELVEGSDQFSYIMVYAKPGVSAQELVEKIENDVNKVNAMSSAEFIESDWQLASQMGTEIIQMMTIIGMLLATLIVAFSTYTLVTRKKRELAIAKALGFGSGQIYLAALLQSMVITLLGLLFSVLIAFTLIAWLPTVIPLINLSVQLQHFVPLAVVSIPVAILSSVIAARTVVKVDPMTVFNA
jgi:ABC-type antimicrobial peptide transport system permease subunit